MSERASSKSPDEPDDGEDETIDVGTTVLAHLLTSDTGGDQIIDSSGSSEDSCLRDMSISQSFPLDTAHQRDADRHADVEPEGINQRTSSPKPLQELGSPEPEDLVSSPTDASTPNYDSYQNRKSMTCSLCDYSTTDRSNFKRHKRLHIRSNPVSVIKCEKCVYTTILPRKIREHYRQQHNMIYTCRQPDGLDASTSLYSGQQPLESSLTYQNLEMTSRQPPGNRSVSMAPSALHTLLTAVGPGRLEYGRLQNPGLAHYERYESQPIQRVQEPHMASDYLRSIVSTVMPPNPLHRAAATSTITSSSYYLNSGGAANHRHLASSTLQNPSLAGMQAMDLQLEQGVKVKQEPVDMVMDTVSSSGVGSRSPEPVRQFDSQPVHRVRHMEPPDSIYGVTSDRGGDAPSTSFSAQLSGSDDRRRDSRRESRHYEEASGSQAPIKTEVNSIGVQCAMSVVKTEPVDRQSESSRRGVRSTLMMTERGTQCELIQCSTAQSTTSQSYGSDSEASDHQPQKPCSKCLHCSVTFEDEVLYSIHIGCHSHTDPYTCNVCGKQCHNKYGFYSHIMRGHQC